MQLGARCSDGSCQAQEDLIAGFSAIEAEAELIQVRLKLCAAAMIRAERERLHKLELANPSVNDVTDWIQKIK